VANGNKPLTIRVNITGVRETLVAFRELPKVATVELRDAAGRIAEMLAIAARARGSASSKQSALVAPTVRVVRDRVPVVQVGGATRVGHRNTPAWRILLGAEFGARSYKQFRPHRGNRGYWFFSTIEGNEERISAEWNRAADEIIRRWGADG
jgi:hypothetical protein